MVYFEEESVQAPPTLVRKRGGEGEGEGEGERWP